jgi:osmoprotectant transport system permease protein
MWPQALSAAIRAHLELSTASLGIAVAIGLPLGIVAASGERMRMPVLGLTGALRALPSLAILTLALPVVGLGAPAAVAALAILAIPPIVAHTDAGLRSVPLALLDAASGIGMTTRQALVFVRWPLALPVLFAGIRTAAVEVVASATLATFVGAGGLGNLIVQGLQTGDDRLLVIGCAAAAGLTLAVEGTFALLQRAIEGRT